jgi:MYXO-CTERM domain-containing protein
VLSILLPLSALRPLFQCRPRPTSSRPITAINYQDDDGNADTVPFPPPADPTGPTWLPLLETPNHPEYPSGHSGTGAAGAGVLAYWFGDDVSFTVGSDSSLGYTRSFTRLSDAAQENADSRIYGGIHFRYANEAGLKIGAQIAAHVTSTFLKETELPPSGEGGAGGADGEGGLGGSTSEAGAPSEGGAGTSGGTSSGGTSSGGSAGTGAVPSGEAGESAATEGGAPADGGAASGGSSGKGGSSGSKGDDDSGCSVAHPSGKSSSAAWLMCLLGLGLLRRRPRQR